MSTKFWGKRGEQVAADFLERHGYAILARNYRFKRAEIDIIAQKENLMLFIEVKLRSSTRFGFPEETVSEAQAARIALAAEEYLETHDCSSKLIRFDILAISPVGNRFRVEHFKDAFC